MTMALLHQQTSHVSYPNRQVGYIYVYRAWLPPHITLVNIQRAVHEDVRSDYAAEKRKFI